MDYGTGTAFTHLDWQKIHAPGLKFYIFQGDEDGENKLFLEKNITFDSNDRKFVLKIYSPDVSVKFKEAEKNNNIYEQRRLTYWALNNKFPDSYVSNNILNDFDKPMGNVAAGLFHNPNGSDGLTVYTFKILKVENKDVTIIKQKPKHYEANLGWARYYDADFPVDINLFVENGKIANGDSYYKSFDFIGEYAESSLFVGKGKGSGIMVGRLRGWGYCEYSYELVGMGVNITLISAGTITGTFQGSRGEQIPFHLGGDGKEYSYGAYYMSGTEWESRNEDGEITFKGTSEGLSLGLPNINYSFGRFQTKTYLIYPLPK